MTALGGASLRFVRDAAGRATQVTAPDGTAIVYGYDAGGNLASVRDLATGAGIRYGYVDGRLALEIPSSGEGRRIDYRADGTIGFAAIREDLATAATFTGHPVSGTLGAGASDSYAFTIRDSELTGTPSGRVILRVATTGDVAPTIAGLAAIASATAGGTRVTLFAVDAAGLYELHVTGSGAYAAELRVAGDIDGNARVDGADSAAVVGLLAGADVTGDGMVTAADAQLVAANFGFRANLSPAVAANLPLGKTHVDLQMLVDLAQVATDPDGDRLFYRVVAASGGTAALTADGRGIVFTPAAGYSGAASVSIAADDGFGSSAAAVIDIGISSAPLVALDFSLRQLGFGGAGDTGRVALIGTFADQDDVVLPYNYVTTTIGDPSIVRIESDGTLYALKDGATYLKIARGGIAAATSMTVGLPSTGHDLMTSVYDIDAYPDSVTLLPNGGTRQVLVRLDPNERYFATGDDGVVFVSGDSSVVTVDADGLIRGVGEGSTTVTAIYRWGEDQVRVSVMPTAIGDAVAIDGETGGIVQSSDGIQIAFGPGALDGDATVSIETLTQAQLTTPLPNADVFQFLGAFDLQVQGAEFTDTVQLAVPVQPGAGQVGDEVWFFASKTLPIGPNGAEQDVWVVIDSGTIDADGMARVKSPPFPGLSTNGNILIAKAARPLTRVRLDIGLSVGLTMLFAPAIGVAAVGGLAGAVTAIGMVGALASIIMLPVAAQAGQLSNFRRYADMEVVSEVLNYQTNPDDVEAYVQSTLPSESSQASKGIVITNTDYAFRNGQGEVTIIGTGFVTGAGGAGAVGDSFDDLTIVLRYGTKEIRLGSDKFEVEPGSSSEDGVITFKVPQDVLLGRTEIFLERPRAGTQAARDGSIPANAPMARSVVFTVDNKQGYAFAGYGEGVEVIDIARKDEVDRLEMVIHSIPLGAPVNEIVVTRDLGAAFAATSKGIALIDTVTLQQVDADPSTPGVQMIALPGTGGVTALAADPGGRYLYAAGEGKVYVIDIDPASANYLKVRANATNAINVEVQSGDATHGHITSMAVNSDGTRLFVSVPVSEMFAADSWMFGRQGKPGLIMVINTDEEDRPKAGTDNSNGWRTVIGKLNAGVEVVDIQATTDPYLMIAAARGDRDRGAKTIEITSDNPNGFTARVTTISTKIGETPGIVEVPFSIGGIVLGIDVRRSTQGPGFDLSAHNAGGVTITPDRQYMFVADWGLPPYYWFQQSTGRVELAARLDEFYQTGAKITVIRDPFGEAEVIGSTTPIPMAFLEELRVDSSGKKLYANYRGAGNLVVLDIETIEDIDVEDKWQQLPIDHRNEAYYQTMYYDPIEVVPHGRGLALQAIDALELITPLDEFDLFNDPAAKLTFEWMIDTDLIEQASNYRTRFYLSSLPPGRGLWPDDRPTTRHFFDSDVDQSILDEGDNNPNRIYTSEPLKSGLWTVDADGRARWQRDIDGKTWRLVFDNSFAKALTAGQEYYWGVEVAETGITEAATFLLSPKKVDAPYNGVTLLTHDMQLGFGLDNTRLADDGGEYAVMAEAIVLASGGGVVLYYDKVTGDWVDVETGLTNAAALAANAGKAVVLLSNWSAESDISDTGFAEAAADAFFASLVRLNQASGNKLFGSPLHMIGHGRGAVVNSEVIQRLGTHFPAAGGQWGIHMTTLDPHDMAQETFAIPLDQIARAAGLAAAALVGIINPAAGARIARLAYWKLPELFNALASYGLKLNPIQYQDFKDPDVQVWENVDFADNYYQDLARTETTDLPVGELLRRLSFTATMNGRALSNTLTAENGLYAHMNTADIDVRLNGRSGFTQDDVAFLGASIGLGGPHGRVFDWYLGTIDTSLTANYGNPIYRRIVDQGRGTLSVVFPTEDFGIAPWYSIDPNDVTTGTPGLTVDTGRNVLDNGVIWEGVGTGWYYSTVGGGFGFRPSSGERVSVAYNNSDGAKLELEDSGTPAVPTIFNGDFELGVKNSIWNYLTQAGNANGSAFDEATYGRYPLSYELPGWSFHGGGGFKLDYGSFLGMEISPLDVTGLMLVQSNPIVLVKDLIGRFMDTIGKAFVDKWVRAYLMKISGVPDAPNLPTDDPEYQKWFSVWGETSPNRLAYDLALKFLQVVDKVIKAAIDSGFNPVTANFNPVDFFGKLSDHNETSFDGAVEFIKKVVEYYINTQFGEGSSDYALVMGGAQALKALFTGIFDTFVPDAPGIEEMRNAVEVFLDKLGGFGGVTHNRLYVPRNANFLEFQTFIPFMFTEGAGLKITISAIDGSVPDFFAPVDFTEAFFEKKMHSIRIPAAFHDKVVSLSFEHVQTEGVVRFGTDYTFPTDIDYQVQFDTAEFEYADLAQSEKDTLRAQAEWLLANHDATVQIYGYTDPRGDIGYNQQLGMQRAQMVTHYLRQYLIAHGDSASRVAAPLSYGESEPVAFAGSNEETWKRERRTEMRVRRSGFEDNGGEAPSGLYDAISQLFFLDKVAFKTVASGAPLQLDAPAGTITSPAAPITLTEARSAFEAAKARWIASGLVADAAARLAGIELAVGQLGAGALGAFDAGTLTLDDDAAGHGWFVDATPDSDDEFVARSQAAWLLDARAGSGASDKADLLSAMMHELGHALGVNDISGTVATRLMTETIGLGSRRLPSTLDVPATVPATGVTATPTVTLQGTGGTATAVAAQGNLLAGAAATQPLANGDFALAGGWSALGGATVAGGTGVLAEDARFLSALRQSFAIPNGATQLSFRIKAATLGTSALLPPDAFEVALIDPVTGASLLDALGGMTLSDAFLNLQADGTLRLAPNVAVTGTPGAGEAIVTVSLTGVARGNGALLSFDLIGMGALDSRVVVDDIAFTVVGNASPVARDDSATVAEDASVAIPLLANDSDADGDALAVTIVGGPQHGRLTAPVLAGAAWTYTPDADYAGSDSFTYSITDGLSAAVIATVAIGVTPVNDAPVLAAPADRSTAAGDAVALRLTASDIDDAADTLVFTLVSGPQGATVSSDGLFAWTATGAGEQPVTVRVADRSGAFAERRFIITVTPAGNAAPVLAAIADQLVDEGAVLTLDVAANDADHATGSLVYSLVAGPAGAAVSADGRFTWTASGASASQMVTLRVTDPLGAFDQKSFRIAVNLVAGNTAPQLAPLADQTIEAGKALIVPLSGSDGQDDASALTYTLVSGPVGATVSPAGTFSWQADGQPRSLAATVRVTDTGGLSAERSFAIVVTAAANRPPVLAEVPAQAVAQGAELVVDLAASDAEDPADRLVFSLVSGPVGATLSSAGRFRWTATGDSAEQPATVRVTDSAGASAERSFRIAIALTLNAAPTLAPVADQAVTIGERVAVQLAAADADHAVDRLVFSLVRGPAGATLTADGRFAWTTDALGDAAVTVRVTDPGDAFAERSFTIAVARVPNTAPVLAPIADLTISEGQTLRLRLQATDADGPASALTWRLVSGPAGATMAADGTLSWFAADGDDRQAFTVRVADAEGAEAETTLNVAVRDVAPTLAVTGGAQVEARSPYAIVFGVTDPGADTPREWVIDWGDGSASERVAGTATGATHVFARAGSYSVRATLANEDGVFAAAPLAVAVAAPRPLLATGTAFVDGGLRVTFSEAVDTAGAGADTVALVGHLTGRVNARLAFDSDGRNLVLTRIDGKPLQYDRYTLVLAERGFVSRQGSLLDGDANGVAGGDYRASLLFASPAPGRAALSDFMRGPGETVDAPRNEAAGLKVRFASDGGVKTMTFTVAYDPALLTVTGVRAGADLPAGATLAFVTQALPGGKMLARITLVSDTAIAAGDRWLVSLDARVPATAPYGSSEVLDVAVEMINAAAPSATQASRSLQLVGFHGDVDGDGRVTLADLWWTTRVAIGLDSEFAAWDGLPPALVTDLADGRPFANPFLPEEPGLPVSLVPMPVSLAAAKPAAEPITYGMAQAIAAWGGATVTTPSAIAPAFGLDQAVAAWASAITATSSAAPAKTSEGSKAPEQPTTAPQPPALPAVDMEATPTALKAKAASTQNGDWLATLLSGDDAAEHDLREILPIFLPALNRERIEERRRRRRRKLEETE